MERQLTQMVRLVDDLLDVSRITTGKFGVRKAVIDLQAVLRDALETVRDFLGLAALQVKRVLLDMARRDKQSPLIDSLNAISDSTNDPVKLALWEEFHKRVDELPDEARGGVVFLVLLLLGIVGLTLTALGGECAGRFLGLAAARKAVDPESADVKRRKDGAPGVRFRRVQALIDGRCRCEQRTL